MKLFFSYIGGGDIKRIFVALITLCILLAMVFGCLLLELLKDSDESEPIYIGYSDGGFHLNTLRGKTVVFLGDSICAGTTVGEDAPEYGYGWAGLIGEDNEMIWENYGRNGAVITAIEGQRRIVSDQVDAALEAYSSVDYVIFEGGTNDADQLGSDIDNLGEISTDYATFDTTTFTGAFEALILKILVAYPEAKVAYIVPPKMGTEPHDSDSNIRRQYFDRAIEVCEKWGIPYLDLWNSNPLNPALSIYYDNSLTVEEAIAAEKSYTDGQHLTLTGYNRIVPQIEAFMRGL